MGAEAARGEFYAPIGSPRCLCGAQKEKGAPFCFPCFAKLPTSLKYELAMQDADKRNHGIRESVTVFRHLNRRPKTGSLFG